MENRIPDNILSLLWRKFIMYDPEESRFYFLLYALISLIFVIFLFKDFIFSRMMLYGADIIQFGYFFRIFLIEYVKTHGSIPQWNPYTFAGIPFVDAIHGNIFYPLSALKFILNPYREYGFELVLHIYLAGIFMYGCAREFQLSKIASTLSGASYMFSGYLVSLVAPGHDGKIFVVALFPLAILFLNKGFRKRDLLNFTLSGLIVGLMLLAPQPQLNYYAWGAICFWSVFKLYIDLRSRGSFGSTAKLGLLVIYSLALGLGISFIQTYPAANYALKYSPRVQGVGGYGFAVAHSLHQEEAFSLFVPEFSGVDSRSKPELHYWGRNSFKDNSEYVGTITLFLAMLGILKCRRKEYFFWSLLALCIFIYALGDTTHIFTYLYRIIPFSSILRGINMSMFVFLFAASITAGMSLHELIGSQQRDYYQEKYVFRKLLWWIPIFILILAILFSMAGQEMLRLYAKIFYPQLLTDSQWAVTRMKNAIEDIPDIVKGFWYASMSLIVVATLITLFLRGILGRRWLLIIPLLIVCNGVRFNQRFISTIDQNKRFGPNPVADYLSTHSSYYRALGFACNDNDFNLGINHIQGTLGNHGNEPYWYYEFLHHDGLLRTFFNRRFVNLLGVKYLIYPKSGILPVDTLGPIPLDTAGIFGEYVIFINHNCFPRAFFVNDFEVIPERKQIYSAILGGKSDVRNRVILEEEPDLELAVGDTSKSSAEISQYDPNYIRISIHTSANKLLVLSDNYYPAWHAYVDGIERRILRAFGSFRAIEVPAGSGEVILKYESPIYDRGVLITLISVTWLAGVLSYYALKKYVLLRRGY